MNREQIAQQKQQQEVDLKKRIRDVLGKHPATADELAEELRCDLKFINSALKSLRLMGANLTQLHGGKLFLNNLIGVGGQLTLQAKDRGDGWNVIGWITDNHLCNRHSRLDVLEAGYDFFAREGVTHILNGGNWVDGEARFNRHELIVSPGMDPQLDYAIENYPQREGITTHFITGDDHEGWWLHRECVNVGEYFEMRARRAGRTTSTTSATSKRTSGSKQGSTKRLEDSCTLAAARHTLFHTRRKNWWNRFRAARSPQSCGSAITTSSTGATRGRCIVFPAAAPQTNPLFSGRTRLASTSDSVL